MMARCQPAQKSIPTPTPIQPMIELIGYNFLEEAQEGMHLFVRPLVGGGCGVVGTSASRRLK
jgi:hypothetical protein